MDVGKCFLFFISKVTIYNFILKGEKGRGRGSKGERERNPLSASLLPN